MKTKKDHFWIYTLRSAVTRSLFIFQITCVTSVLGKLSGMTLDQYNEILLTIYQPQNFRFHLFQLQYSAVSRRTAKWEQQNESMVTGALCLVFHLFQLQYSAVSRRTAKWEQQNESMVTGALCLVCISRQANGTEA